MHVTIKVILCYTRIYKVSSLLRIVFNCQMLCILVVMLNEYVIVR